ncbi:MAG: FAD-binding protein, partial [Calditrichaeota bacterium]
MSAPPSPNPFEPLFRATASKRFRLQSQARQLLLEPYINQPATFQTPEHPQAQAIRQVLSPESLVFELTPWQEEVYHQDSGTAFVPGLLKRLLLNINTRLVVRPANFQDLQTFVAYCTQEKLHFTIRGAGTWPFGGAVPVNGELVLDLSALDFAEIFPERQTVQVAAGVIFANLRKQLREKGLALRQDITNPNSGTVCGWVATGGLGLGAYKYGHVRSAITRLLLLTPDGRWEILQPGDALFEAVFGSEGQLGIVAAVELKVNSLSYTSKPYAFSFVSAGAVAKFFRMLAEWRLKPSSVIYFDTAYLQAVYQVESRHLDRERQRAMETHDPLRLEAIRQQEATLRTLKQLEHTVVLEFDTRESYEQALRYPLFSSSNQQHRYQDLTFWRLPTQVAHQLWDHRYQPVAIKPLGPDMLVSETIVPVARFPAYLEFLRSTVSFWTANPVRTEGHLLNPEEILLQTVLLADTGSLRHKVYFSFVPFMTEAAIQFGGRPYGIGVWNLPFLSRWQSPGRQIDLDRLQQEKNRLDPRRIVNQSKFINATGRNIALRAFQKGTGPLLRLLFHLLEKGKEPHRRWGLVTLGRWLWKANKALFPRLVPPELKAERPPIEQLTAPCAECDSCERVCPTSDVFGLLGLATPITRRKTANRLARGETISQEEALGFLVCTRCDNCTRVCPTDIPLTELFDRVEAEPAFQQALGLTPAGKKEFVERFWDIMKESPLYRTHTRTPVKDDGSHLQHGLKIQYPRGFPYASLYIDPDTCIRCGMCAHENACTYGARQGQPRQIPELIDINCALCNACINFCPQNKAIQQEREFVSRLIEQAVDPEEKRFWQNQYRLLRDTTTIQRSPDLTEMADIYVTEEILMEIDREASTGQIPVSGMGQGDRHMGIGFDAERFSHFHIVGPAQNRLHEGDPDEELSVVLGKHHRYCRFDARGNLHNPPFPHIKLKTPILYNAVPLESNGRVELAFLKVAEMQQTLAVIKFNRLLAHYDYFREAGGYNTLPPRLVPRVDQELIHHLQVDPHVSRELLTDLWQMPMFEVNYHPTMAETVRFIRDSVQAAGRPQPLICGYLEVSEYDLVGGLEILPHLRQRLEEFLALEVDVLHIHGLRNKDNYFVTSQAVRAIHHYLIRSGRRHLVSLIASGGIRLASDSQKTIMRGASATLIDFAALLALDPEAYRAILERRTTTEKLIQLDVDWAVQRLNNQMESRKIQILEVLGAAGFKDLKKTVGEEGRLIDFFELEERLQKTIFEDPVRLAKYQQLNEELIQREPVPPGTAPTYSQLKARIVPRRSPHDFYRLDQVNQTVYQRDFVWPGPVIESLGRMAAGDLTMSQLKQVKSTGLLGDGFDVMKILYQRDPDTIPEEELDQIQTALPLDKGLILCAPWMFGGKSVGSIGLDSWLAHVRAARRLGIQYDTGEGGYPTCFFLNWKGEPIFFTEPDIQAIKPLFQHNHHYTVQEIREKLIANGFTPQSHPSMFRALEGYPDLQAFLFYVVVDQDDEPYVSTELKTGLFGVTKQTIKKARRVVIAYSQGAKMGIGGHILAQKVNRLVSYLRGIEGLEYLDNEKIRQLIERIERLEAEADHPLHNIAREARPHLIQAHDRGEVLPELKHWLFQLQQQAYALHAQGRLDHLEFEHLIRLCEEVVNYSYTSVISPFPFHNCYSIEDVKAFVDVVRMINPEAVISVKVSPSVDIEFIAAGLGRIARDNTEQALSLFEENTGQLAHVLADYARRYGMQIEIWLDGPRGGTGASPNIIKGQMGMHIEYAIPLIHDRLVQDGLRNYVKFMVSGGIRTYEDVIKAIALGADGVIWGTAPMVAIGCDRNRNCHDGCSRGIATTNLIMQRLRDVEENSQQIVNAFSLMQMQVIRALAGLGLRDIRELRGRYDKIQWIGLKERVDFRLRQRQEVTAHHRQEAEAKHATGQSNCGVAAIIGSDPVPSYVLDRALAAMKNRGMDGVGVGKTLCFPDHPDDYAYRIMVKGWLQLEAEAWLRSRNGRYADQQRLRREARKQVIDYRTRLARLIARVFLEDAFRFIEPTGPSGLREPYKKDDQGNERDYREFGNPNTDPGDIFRYFVRVQPEALNRFIEEQLLKADRYLYIREYFPQVNKKNYHQHAHFMSKAEDLYVFNHSLQLSQILYVRDVDPEVWEAFIRRQKLSGRIRRVLLEEDPLSPEHLEEFGEIYLRYLRRFNEEHPLPAHHEFYRKRIRRIAAVMSCGKNFAVWKTAGREIPWETPASPNNIIHVRLATGSIVEQMNAHPFAKLHTALTHNGETTNYEALKQRVEQFGLPPLATTDTEVASLKFHLLAEELEYPDWALFESFSPTTGDDLALVEPALRPQLENVQRVEFTSSPDGPYQYLCLRHLPEKNLTERVDLKDPADLRPSTTAFWLDGKNGKKRLFSIIASEEQAIHEIMACLDAEGLVEGAQPDQTLVSSGMISRFRYNQNGRMEDFQLLDRYGRAIELPDFGEHYSVRRHRLRRPKQAAELEKAVHRFLQQPDEAGRKTFQQWMAAQLTGWDFNTYRWVLHFLSEQVLARAAEAAGAPSGNGRQHGKGQASSEIDALVAATLQLFTYFIDHLRHLDTGRKAKSSLRDLTQRLLEDFLDRLGKLNLAGWQSLGFPAAQIPVCPDPSTSTLLLNARGFAPEGTDPRYSLALALAEAYRQGWRRYLLYRVRGQRLISTAVMGRGDTDDVVMDVYGIPGEYFAAFMQGGTVRMHGSAQNFCAMVMHHGYLTVYGNAGKVCGYASKGGKVFILGDIVDRAWTNSVNDPRCQSLQVHVLGSASKYAGESLMG